jgi:hypothetical protein
VARDFKAAPEAERWKIVRENVIALYDLDIE